MEWIRHHPKSSAVGAAIATVLVIILVWMMISPADNKEPDTLGLPDPALPTTTLTELPTPSPTPTETPTTGQTGGQVSLPGFGSYDPNNPNSPAQGGSMNVPGYAGGSYFQFAPKHRITLKVTSAAPIGTIGWTLLYTDGPTSGRVNAGRSWSMTRTVYGEPDYARLFFGSGGDSTPVTCTIIVDGKVTEQRSTSGPYAQMMCQG